MWVLLEREERARKRVSFQCIQRRFFPAPAIVGLSTKSSPSTVSYDISQPCESLFSIFTSPVVAIAVNESLRAADMARKCTPASPLAKEEEFSFFRVCKREERKLFFFVFNLFEKPLPLSLSLILSS